MRGRWTVRKVDGWWCAMYPSGNVYCRFLFWFDAYDCAFHAAGGFPR